MPDTFIPPPALSTVKFLLVIFAVQAMLLYAVHRTSVDLVAARRRVLFGHVVGLRAILTRSALPAPAPTG